MRPIKTLLALVFMAAMISPAPAQTSTPTLSGEQIIERVSPAVVLILVGSGDGQVAAIGSGLAVRADGILLTANHLVKGMKEVQVRLKNGEVYDRVELLANDERRDIAALRIPASGLTVLPTGNSSEVRAGTPVFVVSNGAGLPWTASSGVLSATRMADEVPGAGSGYRLLQVTAPMSPGSSGGVLVDGQARALGIVVGSVAPGQNVNFAVPVESVLGLAAVAGGTPFASGARLQFMPPARTSAPAARTLPPAPELPRGQSFQIRTVSAQSKTVYIRRERLQDDLRNHPLFGQLGLRFADYGETADAAVTVDRPFLTYDWTYTLVYQPTGITLSSGTIVADDEFDAGPALAAQIMDQLAAAAVLPRSALRANPAPPRPAEAGRADPVTALRTCKSIFVESHTIYLKGNHLQDALYTRPELREWGIRIADDRQGADIYIDVTRPFLTFDWVYKMMDNRTGAVLASGKVVAWDGPIAAPQLASEIVKHIRAARPLPSAEKQVRD
jgi:trypsin-like peptidase